MVDSAANLENGGDDFKVASAATLCECPDYDPICACAGCNMPMDDCDAKHDQLGDWCCPSCSHSAKLGVPHPVHYPSGSDVRPEATND